MHGIITAIALPFRVRCGVRIMKSMSKCDAFLPLYWRVKRGPRSVDMPDARWSATHGCHSGITSWSPWPELRTRHPSNIFITFALLHCTWWRHKMEIFSALLALCEGNPSVTGRFSSQVLLTQSFDVFFDLCLNKRLSKQWRRRWFENSAYCDVTVMILMKLKLVLLACVNSLPCKGDNYIRQQWLRWWLVAYSPKSLPEQMAIWDYWHPSQFFSF